MNDSIEPVKTPDSPPTDVASSNPVDRRVYVVKPDDSEIVVKHTWEKEYCYSRTAGEEHFHLFQKGELYLRYDGEKLCLNCALKRNLLTTDREYWRKH